MDQNFYPTYSNTCCQPDLSGFLTHNRTRAHSSHHSHSSIPSPFLSYASITTCLIAACIKSPPFVYMNVCNDSHPFELVPHHAVWTLAGALAVEKRQQLDVLVGGDLNTNYSRYMCASAHTDRQTEAMHKSMSL